MPQNVILNFGSGGERLTVDEIVEAGVTVQAQYIKILSGSAASTAAIGGTLAQGLMVDVTRVQGNVAVSAAGTQLVSGIVSVQGSVLVSAAGTQLVSGIVTVQGNVQVSAAGTQIVTGIVTVGGTVLVSAAGTQLITGTVTVVGTVLISAAGTQLVTGIVTVQGSVLVSAVGHVLVSGDGNFAVVGDVAVSADPTSTFFVATSVDRTVYAGQGLGGFSANPVSSNGTPNPIKYVYINASAAGDLTLVASTASRSIRVIGYAIICPNSALPIFFQDSEATTVPKILAAFTVVTGGGVSYAGSIFSPAFQTTVGAGLELKRGATSDAIVQGHLTYIEIS